MYDLYSNTTIQQTNVPIGGLTGAEREKANDEKDTGWGSSRRGSRRIQAGGHLAGKASADRSMLTTEADLQRTPAIPVSPVFFGTQACIKGERSVKVDSLLGEWSQDHRL